MTRPLSAAQRRIVDEADPVTGRLKGGDAQLARLVLLKLAFRHPRPPHDHFLTPAGYRIWEAGDEPERAEQPPPPAPSGGGPFAARVGGEAPVPGGPARAREVRSAWQGLVEMRRMTNPGGATDRPCAWERAHLVQAAALALEAAGCRPADGDTGDGYRVGGTPQPEAVAVRGRGPDGIAGCAAALERAGWQVSEHAEPRTGGRYLLASPRRS
ncbi:hypothetical protein CG723_02205 [Streptomyces sp. CB01635]|uniref:hypothetical protein n=1 Tax=unclassified Streptomyces TaxID=2593676 RepID=UPI000C2743F2|nr:hypothetical protein [Streptomyces sp. CB01635]PJN13409.1 hypothetical protein CG723_02205 [Streptomyces sp. CB01635]